MSRASFRVFVLPCVLAALGWWQASGCAIKVAPIKVEPIDITLRIYLEADEKLDAFFESVPDAASTPSPTGGSTP